MQNKVAPERVWVIDDPKTTNPWVSLRGDLWAGDPLCWGEYVRVTPSEAIAALRRAPDAEPSFWISQHDAREIAMPASVFRDGIRAWRQPTDKDGNLLVPVYAAPPAPDEQRDPEHGGTGSDGGKVFDADPLAPQPPVNGDVVDLKALAVAINEHRRQDHAGIEAAHSVPNTIRAYLAALSASPPQGERWEPIERMPTDPGTRIKALVETELVMEEHIPALLMGGWKRDTERDRIIGWLAARPAQGGSDE